MMKPNHKQVKRWPLWLIVLLIIVFLLRVPSLFEPYYYGDEMIYLTLGEGIRQGLTLYKDIYDNKPPLLYLVAAIAGNLFWFKAILCFWNIFTIVMFYRLLERVFKNNNTAQIAATSIFALLTTLPLFEGTIVNAELFMIVFSILGIGLTIFKKTYKSIFVAGLFFGIGTLFKIPAAFDILPVIFFWIIYEGVEKWKEILKRISVLSLGFVIVIASTFVWYGVWGAFGDYFRSAFLQTFGYLSSFRPEDTQKSFLIKNAPLLIRLALTFAGSFLLYLYRKHLSPRFILGVLWLLFGIFAVTLSERPYPHYLIQITPPLSILLAMLITEKTVEQALVVFPITLAFLAPVYYKFYYYSTTQYYSRFVNTLSKGLNRQQFLTQFSQTTDRNYEIAEFIANSSKPDDKVFMWDPDSATVYALSRRLPPIKYTSDYHVYDYSSKQEVVKLLTQSPPKFIVLTSQYPLTEIQELIRNKYLLIKQIQNANIYARRNLDTPAK